MNRKTFWPNLQENYNQAPPPPGAHNQAQYSAKGRRKIKKPKGSHVDKVRHSKLKFDKKLANGPATNRGCTDIFCCVLFFAFLVGYAYIFIYSLSQGQPHLLVTPFDTDGNGCGYSPGYENERFIYFWRVSLNFEIENENLCWSIFVEGNWNYRDSFLFLETIFNFCLIS